jgi:nicotinamide phosphoribosyltransferase
MTQCIEDKLELIYDTDSYKKTHEPAYPEGLEYVQSYLEARKYEFPIGDELNGEKPIVIFGLQYILEKFFIGQVITKEIIDEAEKFDALHFGQYTFNKKGWMEILTEHGGKLPIKICSVREGTVMGVRQVILTIENTDPKCGWLVNYLETMLMRLWYPITVATKSYLVKQKILKYLKLSGTPESIDFKVQDFGSRGTETRESAKIGGASHLVNFKGSDTVIAI